ncbi:hypothetical protein D9758_006095 [Tetrapyrgos nigripes]|uniref:DH domain-containing protein n=1 Tax=Tetrapyrgos nigripes TaxID=182062 RepID=A0A8H5G042_9AGAR|nr:hypothetical protein D9758_006095 [Tetrapyrgos nigripes]
MTSMTSTDNLRASCAALRSNLLSLKNFASRYLYELLDADDPKLSIQTLCRSALPLCYLFNLLPEQFFPKIDVDLEATDEHSRSIAIALFAMNAKRVLGCQYFTLGEILHEDTEGLQKAVNALSAIIHLLPDSEFDRGTTPSPSNPAISVSGSTAHPASSDFTDTLNETIWKNRVRTMLNSERRYVKAVEVIERYSVALREHGPESIQETVAHVFPKKFFTFIRKFCIQLECTAQLPPQNQRWGRLFADTAMDIQILYKIYCVNRILAETKLHEQDTRLLQMQAHPSSSSSITQLLDRPLEHLSDYEYFFDALVAASDSDNAHYEELLTGRAIIKATVAGVHFAQKQTKTQEIIEMLKSRVSDWKDLIIDDAGFFDRRGTFLVRINEGAPLYSEFYLFEKELVFFHDRLTTTTSRVGGRRKTVSSTINPSAKPMPLNLTCHVPATQVESITLSFQSNGGSFSRAYSEDIISSPSIYELAISSRSDTLAVMFQGQDRAKLWQTSIERCRTEALAHEAKSGSPSPSQFNAQLAKSHAMAPGLSPDKQPHPEVLDISDVSPTKDRFAAISNEKRIIVRLNLGNSDFHIHVDLPVTYEELMMRIWWKLKLCRGRMQFDYPTVSYLDVDGREEVITPKKDLTSIFSQGPPTVLYVR